MKRLGPESRLDDGFAVSRQRELERHIMSRGICRICGCTDDHPCSDDNSLPCSWVDVDHTLCDNLECIAQVPMCELEEMTRVEEEK